MIVRLMNLGQYRVSDELRSRLDDLDAKAVEALERDDEQTLDGYLEEMWALVQREGEELPPENLSPSDVIIPPADLTLEETRQLFSEDGLIPDLPT